MGKSVRKRIGKSDQPNRPETQTSELSKVPESQQTSNKSSSAVLVLLFVMVAITWGVAATAYFGVVDYKVLVGVSETLPIEEKASPIVKENLPKDDPVEKVETAKVPDKQEIQNEKPSNEVKDHKSSTASTDNTGNKARSQTSNQATNSMISVLTSRPTIQQTHFGFKTLQSIRNTSILMPHTHNTKGIFCIKPVLKTEPVAKPFALNFKENSAKLVHIDNLKLKFLKTKSETSNIFARKLTINPLCIKSPQNRTRIQKSLQPKIVFQTEPTFKHDQKHGSFPVLNRNKRSISNRFIYRNTPVVNTTPLRTKIFTSNFNNFFKDYNQRILALRALNPKYYQQKPPSPPSLSGINGKKIKETQNITTHIPYSLKIRIFSIDLVPPINKAHHMSDPSGIPVTLEAPTTKYKATASLNPLNKSPYFQSNTLNHLNMSYKSVQPNITYRSALSLTPVNTVHCSHVVHGIQKSPTMHYKNTVSITFLNKLVFTNNSNLKLGHETVQGIQKLPSQDNINITRTFPAVFWVLNRMALSLSPLNKLTRIPIATKTNFTNLVLQELSSVPGNFDTPSFVFNPVVMPKTPCKIANPVHNTPLNKQHSLKVSPNLNKTWFRMLYGRTPLNKNNNNLCQLCIFYRSTVLSQILNKKIIEQNKNVVFGMIDSFATKLSNSRLHLLGNRPISPKKSCEELSDNIGAYVNHVCEKLIDLFYFEIDRNLSNTVVVTFVMILLYHVLVLYIQLKLGPRN